MPYRHKTFDSGKRFKYVPFIARASLHSISCQLFHTEQLRDPTFWTPPIPEPYTSRYLALMKEQGRLPMPRDKFLARYSELNRRAQELYVKFFSYLEKVAEHNRALLAEPDAKDVITSAKSGCLEWHELLPFGIIRHDMVKRGWMDECLALSDAHLSYPPGTRITLAAYQGVRTTERGERQCDWLNF